MTNYTGNDKIRVKWVDSGREPQCDPSPDYPKGRDIGIFDGTSENICVASLPYPARRCGYFWIHCKTCNFSVVLTTAGRPDDPRSIALPCDSHNA